MPADSSTVYAALHPMARYLVTVSGRRARLLCIAAALLAAGLVAAVLVLSGQVGVAVATAGIAGGAIVAAAGVRRVAAAQRDDVVRLSILVERRAEQVAALSHELRTPLSTATPMPAADLIARGAGQLDVNAALAEASPTTA